MKPGKRNRNVRETWTSQVDLRICNERDAPHVDVFVSDKFKLYDIVRVTVELLDRKGRK